MRELHRRNVIVTGLSALLAGSARANPDWPERPITIVHARSTADAEAAAARLRETVTVSPEPNAGPASPILRRMAR